MEVLGSMTELFARRAQGFKGGGVIRRPSFETTADERQFVEEHKELLKIGARTRGFSSDKEWRLRYDIPTANLVMLDKTYGFAEVNEMMAREDPRLAQWLVNPNTRTKRRRPKTSATLTLTTGQFRELKGDGGGYDSRREVTITT